MESKAARDVPQSKIYKSDTKRTTPLVCFASLLHPFRVIESSEMEYAERLRAWFWWDKLYLSINDVAYFLKVSYKTVYRKIRRGFLPARKINGRYLIHPDDLDRLLLSPDERCP